MAHIAVEIPESFSSFMDATLVRLQAIYPGIGWHIQGEASSQLPPALLTSPSFALKSFIPSIERRYTKKLSI